MATELVGNNADMATEDRWRAERRNIYDVVFTRYMACFAITALTLSFFLPTEGLGVSVCWFKSCLGLSCPGCGLTRSVTCISHLEFGKAWSYHPFGLLIYALFLANAVFLFVPKAIRSDLKDRASRNDRWLRPVYMAIVLSFVAFGVLRALLTVLFT